MLAAAVTLDLKDLRVAPAFEVWRGRVPTQRQSVERAACSHPDTDHHATMMGVRYAAVFANRMAEQAGDCH
jgi:hypothetical protein